MKICGLLKKDHIFYDLEPGDKEAVLKNFVKALKECGCIQDDKKILEEVLKRESLSSTGLKKGIAVPHAFSAEIPQPFLALAVFKEGIEFEALDQMPTYVLLLLLGNDNAPGAQLKILAHVCRLVKETDFVAKVKNADSPQDVCRILETEEALII